MKASARRKAEERATKCLATRPSGMEIIAMARDVLELLDYTSRIRSSGELVVEQIVDIVADYLHVVTEK